jgi:hypothetical protein
MGDMVHFSGWVHVMAASPEEALWWDECLQWAATWTARHPDWHITMQPV